MVAFVDIEIIASKAFSKDIIVILEAYYNIDFKKIVSRSFSYFYIKSIE